MKIGIDIQASKGRMTGLGVYTKNLLKALLNERPNGQEFIAFSKDQEGDWNTFQRLLWENADLPKQVKRHQVDILHIPAFSPPCVKPCRVVVTVHDLIGMIFSNQLGWPSRFYWGKWLPFVVKRADAIIADSESTRNDLQKYLQIPASKIRVIYPSGHEGFSPLSSSKDQEKIRKRLGIREKYFLCVGTLEPRKNFIRIAQAFSRFIESKKDTRYQLVVVGLTDFAHGKFLKRVLQNCSSLADSLILAGFQSHEDLNLLYSGAEGFLFPSLYEGFGIPVLEAMASGTPVLTSRTSSLPEVAGEAAHYVDPNNLEEISEGIRSLAEDPGLRNKLIEKGFERIKRFSWRDTALKTIEVYDGLQKG